MNMHSIYDENKVTNPFEERVIIDLAGVASGMLMNNLILSSEDLKKFIYPFNGLPVLIPWIPKMFDTYETFMVKHGLILPKTKSYYFN